MLNTICNIKIYVVLIVSYYAKLKGTTLKIAVETLLHITD